MNIVMITENDPAGTCIAFTNAINRYPEHSCRLVTTATRYNFEFEKDVHVPDLDEAGLTEVTELLRTADIFHFHMLADEHMRLGPIDIKGFMAGKGILHHHHGHPDFRGGPGRYQEKYDRLKRRTMVSTPDLLKLLPGSVWQPNLVPIHDPCYRPRSIDLRDKIRVCQAPTRKDLKNTTGFKFVMAHLEQKYRKVKGVIIENTSHEKCLKIKQACDIHFDHMQGYYGVSSLESLSQGRPVIAGLDEWNIKNIKAFSGCETVPWVIAKNEDELKDRIEQLILNEDLRSSIGKNSRRFMERHWTEPQVLNILLGMYESL